MGRSILLLISCVCAVLSFGQAGTKMPNEGSGDSSHIDLMNERSAQYILDSNRDSASYYADLAFQGATSIHYLHGMAVSNLRKCQIAKHFDDDILSARQFGRESLNNFEQTGNKKEIDKLYPYLFRAAIDEGNFDSAMVFSDDFYEVASANNDQNEIFSALAEKFAFNRQSGNYEKSFEFAQKLYEIAQQAGNKFWIANSLWWLGQLYKLIEDYPNAMTYYRKVYEMSDEEVKNERIRNDMDIWFNMEYAELFTRSYKYDSAWFYYQKFKPSNKALQDIYWVSLGEYYFAQGNFRQAMDNFHNGLEGHRKHHDVNEVARTLIDISKTHLGLSEFPQAIQFAREGLNIAESSKQRQFMRDGYQVLSLVYERMGRTDSSNYYFRKYSFEKEAMLNDQVKGNFKSYTYDQQISNMNKEKQIQEIRLQKESLVRNILVGSIGVLLIFAFILFRNIMLKRRYEARQRELVENELQIQKLEAEKSKTELMHQKSALEMKALRAQMNPHFIFNCLNSINRFIVRNDADRAADYLTKFAKLIRKVLEESGKPFILLEDELNSLQLYMDLEAIRFEIPFRYEIFCSEKDKQSVMVPSLLIQPFVENAIWHGLHPRLDGNGIIKISLTLENEILHCEITDNGVGRAGLSLAKDKSKDGKKSLGILLTRHRLELADPLHRESLGFYIEDLKDEKGMNTGTSVHLRIPVKFV
ncbi:MAG: histidine kinase [Chitinophagales bacterium]